MTFDQAKQTILSLLQAQGRAKNSEMLAALGGDEALFAQVREDLLFDDLAEDKKGVGLIYTGPAATPHTNGVPPPLPAPTPVPTPAASRPRRIFLSYGRADAEALAFRLQADLEAHGHAVWLDKQQIRSGASWEEQIEVAILGHEVFVSLLTPHAVRRPDGVCLDEISLARYGGRKIVPAMVLQCRPPLGIYRLDWVDFQEWQMPGRYEASLRRLLAAVEGDAQVEGTYARLFASLKPLDFGAEVARLTRDFTGRAWLFAELDAWLADPASRVFLLTGDPGSGKSAVLAQLVQRDPRVAAYHFCVASLADSLDPFRFARSIAAQLATQLPGYRAALEAADLSAAETDPGALFRRLVVDPLAAEQPDGPALIVVDALDEAATASGRTIAAVLAEHLRDLPPWVRLVLSSRKSPALLDRFSAFQPRELDAARAENLADVAAYLDHRLAEPPLAQVLAAAGVSAEATAAALIERGAGNFLYVVQAADALAAGQLDPRHPERFPAGLVGIYQDFFGRVYPGGAGFERVRPLLDVILAAREPLTVEQIGRFAGVDPFDAADLLEPLAPFFPLREGRVQAYHKSVADWLAGEAGQSRAYRVNAAAGHRRLADALMAGWQSGQYDRFTLAHLPAHLMAANRPGNAYNLLTDYRFIRANVESGMVNALLADCDEVLASAPGGRDPRALELLQGALRLSVHVLANDADQLPSQLHGRLLGFQDETIQPLLETARRETQKPWLRPLTPSLDPAGGPMIRILKSHSGVMSLALTLNETLAIAALFDGALQVWDLTRGQVLRTLLGHTAPVTAVAVTSDGEIAISGSEDRTVRVWETSTGSLLHTLTGHERKITAVALIPGEPNVISTSEDGALKVWNLPTGSLMHSMTGHSARYAEARAVSVSRDGGRAVVACGSVYDYMGEAMLAVVDLKSMTVERTLAGHTAMVTCVAVTTDGGKAVSGSLDDTVRVWDLTTGCELRTLRGHTNRVRAVTLTPNNRYAISGADYGTIKVWDPESGEELRTLTGHTNTVTTLSSTQDGSRIISGSMDGTLRLWDLTKEQEFRAPAEHSQAVVTVITTPDGLRAVSGSSDGTLVVWELATGNIIHRLVGHSSAVSSAAVTPDGSHLISASLDGTVKLWDLGTGQATHSFVARAGTLMHVAVTPDGRQMVSGSSDNTIRVWDFQHKALRFTLMGDSSWFLGVEGLLITPDGGHVVCRSGWAGDPLVWDLTKGELAHVLKGHRLSTKTMCLMPNGKQVVTGSSDYTLRLWDLRTGETVRVFEGHSGDIESVIATPDAQHIISSSADKTLRYWDVESGMEVWRRVSSRLDCIAPDGRHAVVHEGTTVRILSLDNQLPVASFDCGDRISSVDLSPILSRLVIGGGAGRVHILRWENTLSGAPILTGWRDANQSPIAFGCTHCRTWSEVPASALGTELLCLHCGKPVKLNPFVIEADWRPVAAAWGGEV